MANGVMRLLADPVAPPAESLPEERSPQMLQAGIFLFAVGVPLAIAPFTRRQFVDVKVLLVAVAALAVWKARPRIDSLLAKLAAAWIAIASLAVIFGVDPWWGLLGQESHGTGFVVLAASAVALLAGAAMPPDLLRRVPGWLVGAGIAMTGIALIGKLLPAMVLRGVHVDPSIAFGSTLLHPVYFSAFITAAIAAVLAARRSRGFEIGAVAVLAVGLVLASKRMPWIGASLAIAIVAWRMRAWRRVFPLLVVLAIGFLAWTGGAGDEGNSLLGAERLLNPNASLGGRTMIWQDVADAVAERPLLGWGPANTWTARLANADADSIRIAGRGWGDAHNIFAESAATTGVLGLAALAGLLGVAGLRALRAPPDRAWAVGGAAALLVHHLLQPLSPSVTPLFFLLLGVAAGGRPGRDRRIPRAAWLGGAAVLVLCLVAATMRFTGSTFEWYAWRFESQPAARLALRVEPWRISAADWLASRRALDSLGDSPGAAEEAAALSDRIVRDHPWLTGARIASASADMIAGRLEHAGRLLDEHLARFPNDPRGLVLRGVVALRSGDRELGEELVRRAASLERDGPAGALLRQIERGQDPSLARAARSLSPG